MYYLKSKELSETNIYRFGDSHTRKLCYLRAKIHMYIQIGKFGAIDYKFG